AWFNLGKEVGNEEDEGTIHAGQGLLPDASVPVSLVHWIGRQLRTDPASWPRYAAREETRRDGGRQLS
ncbi:MAG: DUF4158 domain-containing protein, partial [Burkholderiales bacterium]|nr:DUF4158 domain-containing protein [Burkholderiales bacterium]